MNNDMKINERAAHAPEEIRKLADRFLRTHDCPVVLSREENGYHLYIPCPECLHTHGRRELDDPKYSINLSMLAGLGEFATKSKAKSFMPGHVGIREDEEKRREYGSSICMRTRSSKQPHRFNIDELLNMATVTERHPDILTKASLHGGAGSAEREEMWEEDPVSGKMGPPPPGDVIPLYRLPPSHPAIKYLTDRGYDIEKLESQFRCVFCTKEYDGEAKAIFYRKMPGGWKDTPQHRVIFYSLIDGAPLTWQARVIEKVSDDGLTKLMLHPYAGGFYPGGSPDRVARDLRTHGQSDLDPLEIIPDGEGTWGYLWSRTHTRANPQAPWQPISPFDEMRDDTLKFKPSKYRTAKYSSRQMMGWDAAVARAAADPATVKWVVLCEGPLDAARVGPGGVALIGSSISEDNAAKVASNFHIAFSAFDNDKAGKDATDKITKVLMSTKQRATVLQGVPQIPIPPGKDLGDLTADEFSRLMKNSMKNLRRAF